MPLNLTLAFLLAAVPASAQNEVSSSTQAPAARPPEPVFGAPLKLRFDVDRNGQPRGSLGFSLRWDASDIPALPRHVATLALDPFGTAARAAGEALSGADIGIYSLHFKAGDVLPVALIVSPLAYASEVLRPPTALEPAGAPRPAPAVEDRRRRLDLTPVTGQIESSLRRELRRTIINAGFGFVPEGRGVPYGQKEAIVHDLEQAGSVWGDDLEDSRRSKP